MDEFLSVARFIVLCFAGGCLFTAGMWVWCKATKWAPVNITVNLHSILAPKEKV